jgi:hypothetical protein
MKIIFEQTMSTELNVYIHCTSAGEQLRLSESIHTHSEYHTKWSQLLDEWAKKEYYKYFTIHQMSSRNHVITLLVFTNSKSEEFIKELSNHLDDDMMQGYYSIEYKSFGDE